MLMWLFVRLTHPEAWMSELREQFDEEADEGSAGRSPAVLLAFLAITAVLVWIHVRDPDSEAPSRKDDLVERILFWAAAVAAPVPVRGHGHVHLRHGTRLRCTQQANEDPMTTAEALLIGGTVAIVILLFMLRMYSNPRIYPAIVIGSLLVMTGSLFLARNQTTQAAQRPVPEFTGELDPDGGEVTQPQDESPLQD